MLTASSTARPFISASFSAVLIVIELSQRLPLNGDGAIYGQSVSSMILSMGIASHERTAFFAFLNVSTPVKLIYRPRLRSSDAVSGLPEKQ